MPRRTHVLQNPGIKLHIIIIHSLLVSMNESVTFFAGSKATDDRFKCHKTPMTSHDLQFNVRRCWPYVLPNSSSRDPKAARPRRPENPWKAPRLSVRRWIRRRKNRQTVREAETSKVPRRVCLKNFSCYFLSQWILRLSLYNMLHENSLRKQLSQFVLAVFLAFNLLIADICRLLTFSNFFISKVDHR